MSENYDVIVIGAGPAGYVAAIRCAQLGLKTACIDDFLDEQDKPSPGGTCLNVGCIPSKALLESSHHYQQAQQHFVEHGINIGQLSLDLPAMQQRKTRVVRDLTGGTAVAARSEAHGHVFILPWRGHSIVGTTDTPFDAEPNDLAVTEAFGVKYRTLGVLPRSRRSVFLLDRDRTVRYTWVGEHPLDPARDQPPLDEIRDAVTETFGGADVETFGFD